MDATPDDRTSRLNPFESGLVNAFQLLNQGRMQSLVVHEAPLQCIDKCMDKDELFESKRVTMPLNKRLKVDAAEKKCVLNCGAKWDELYRRTVTNLNKHEVAVRQQQQMMQMMMPPAENPRA